MIDHRHMSGALALTGIGLLAIGLRANAQALKVRLGLWEVTSTSQSTGFPPVDSSRVPPELRARAEAALKAKADTQTRRVCITREELEQDPFQEANVGPSCTKTTIAHTSSLGEFTFECTDAPKMSGRLRYEAVTLESVKITVMTKISTSEGAKPMTSNTTLTSRWITASCGDVK